MYLTLTWYSDGVFENLIYDLKSFLVEKEPLANHWDHIDIVDMRVFLTLEKALESFSDDEVGVYLMHAEDGSSTLREPTSEDIE